MQRYSKTIVALLGALSTWGVTASEDGVYSQPELWGALLALATAAGVWAFPNRPPRGRAARADISEQGQSDPLYLLVVVVVVLLLVYVVTRLF